MNFKRKNKFSLLLASATLFFIFTTVNIVQSVNTARRKTKEKEEKKKKLNKRIKQQKHDLRYEISKQMIRWQKENILPFNVYIYPCRSLAIHPFHWHSFFLFELHSKLLHVNEYVAPDTRDTNPQAFNYSIRQR
jgi:hypothetical protein